MIVPTVIAIAAPIAARITHWTASPRSGSSARTSRTRCRAASNSITPTPISGNSAASATPTVWMRLLMRVSFVSDREDLRHRRIAEEQQEPEAEHDLRDEHRLRAFTGRALQVGQLPVAQARRLRPKTRLCLRPGSV